MKPFARLLLEAALARMAGLEARMAGGLLGSPEALEDLQSELEDLGWAMALISAVGEGQPDLARHHPQGHRVLLDLLGLSAQLPDLAPDPGGGLAWALAELTHGFESSTEINVTEGELGWTVEVHHQDSAAQVPLPMWFVKHKLEITQNRTRCRLQFPAAWLIKI